jgi:hypothetical protein
MDMRWVRLLVLVLLTAGWVTLALAPGPANARPLRLELEGEGLIANPMGTQDIAFLLTFDPEGGEVSGMVPSYSSGVSMSLEGGLSVSGEADYDDCPIQGSFQGGDGGTLTGSFECTGRFTQVASVPGAPVMTGSINLSGAFEGKLWANGAGEGVVDIVSVTMTDPVTVQGMTVPASTSPPYAVSSTWTLAYSAEEFQAALAPVPVTDVPPTTAPPTAEALAPVEEPTAAPIEEAPEESVAAPVSPAQTAQNPLIALAGAAGGVITGAAVTLSQGGSSSVQSLRFRKAQSVPASKPPQAVMNDKGQVLYKPPWDQGDQPYWISKAEYDSIQRHLGRGEVWSDRWGWKTPDDMAYDEAALQRSRDRAQAESRARNARLMKDVKESLAKDPSYQENLRKMRESRQRVIDNQREHVASLTKSSEMYDSFYKYWNKMATGAEWVEWGADKGVSILSYFTGPVGNYINKGYTVLKSAAKEGTNYAIGVKDLRTAARSFVEDGVVEAFVESDAAKGVIKETSAVMHGEKSVGEAVTSFAVDIIVDKAVDTSVEGVLDGVTKKGDRFIPNSLRTTTGNSGGIDFKSKSESGSIRIDAPDALKRLRVKQGYNALKGESRGYVKGLIEPVKDSTSESVNKFFGVEGVQND